MDWIGFFFFFVTEVVCEFEVSGIILRLSLDVGNQIQRAA